MIDNDVDDVNVNDVEDDDDVYVYDDNDVDDANVETGDKSETVLRGRLMVSH